MPQFHYESYQNPYVASVGDLLLRPGEIEAARAMRVADAQARAAEQRGAAWGNAVQTAGNAAAGAVTQLADPARKLTAIQLKDAQSAAKSKAVFEAELHNPGNWKPDGTIDDAKVTARLQRQDVGAWEHWSSISAANAKNSLDLREKVATLQKTEMDTVDRQRQMKQVQSEYLGRLAYSALDILKQKAGDPTHARDTFLASTARAAVDGAVTPEAANQMLKQVRQATPEQIQSVLDSFVTPDIKAKLDKERADIAHTEAQTADLQAGGKMDLKPFRVNGKDGIMLREDSHGNLFHRDGTKVEYDDIVEPMPPAAVQAANDPAAAAVMRDNAEQLFEGHLLPEDLSKRGASYNATLAEANKISKQRTGKSIDVTKQKLDYQAAKRFVSTMNGSQMVRYRGLSEAVVNTINEVNRLGDELQQGGVQKWNEVKRSTIRQVYGNTPESELANQYLGAVNTLKEEFANLANGGFAPTEAAWALANDQIKADYGFKDLRASLSEVQRLINFRSRAFADQTPFKIGGGNDDQPPARAGGAGPGGLTANTTHDVVQDGHTFRVTTDAAGKVIKSEFIR
jgi:hypothetical protein